MPATSVPFQRDCWPPTRRRGGAWAAAVAAGLALGGFSAPAPALPVASAWTTVELPGGVAGLRRLLGPSVDASRVFIETARRIDSPDEDEAGPRGDIRAYMDAVDGLWRALGNFPSRTARLSLPMGRWPVDPGTDALASALGVQWREEGGGFRLGLASSTDAANRRHALVWAGLDVESMVRAVNGGAAVDVSLTVDRVPLPMGEGSWQQVAFEGRQAAASPAR
jgi:hypothetical protein